MSGRLGTKDAYQARLASAEWRAAAGLVGECFAVGPVSLGGASGRRQRPPDVVEEADAIAESAAATEDLVYAVQMEGPPYAIKVGLTRVSRLRTRLAALAGGTPSPVILLRVWPGGPRLERYVHGQLGDYRLNGEWFEPTPEVVRLVGRGRIIQGERSWVYAGPGSENAPPITITYETLDEDVERAVLRARALERRAQRAA